jgi:hypothetical protein
MSSCSRGIQSLFPDHDAMAGCLRCLLMVFVGGLTAAAQRTQSQAFYLPGEAPILVPQAENASVNFTTMGLRISSDFDDNALNNQQNHQADFAVFIEPHLGWRVSRARVDWTADYTLGLARSQKIAAHDSLSHLLDSGFQVKLTKRLRLRVDETYLSSANPFDQLQALQSATGPGVHVVPSVAATVTPADLRTERSTVDIAYAVGAHSTMGVGGEFFIARYSLPSPTLSSNQLLQDSSSATGRAYYLRQITRHQWSGLDYRVLKATFNSGRSWSMVQSLTYTHTIAVLRPMTVSFFVGPERSVAQTATGVFGSSSTVLSEPPLAWHWSRGASGRWSGKRTTVGAMLSTEIDNGGLLGAAQLTTSSTEISRQLARQWTARLLASYQHGNTLAGSRRLNNSSVAACLTHSIRPGLSFEIQYWRMHMSGNASLPAGLLADHNRVSMSLVYEHSRALGQ